MSCCHVSGLFSCSLKYVIVNLILNELCRLLEMLAPDINKGLRNDFREAMEQVDQDYLDDMLQQQQVNIKIFK